MLRELFGRSAAGAMRYIETVNSPTRRETTGSDLEHLEPDPWPDPVRVDDGACAFTLVAGIGLALTFVRARS
ncbi:hypothetical protein [Micromonospora sp. NPDC051006]|uniref:hypothetical protein n=1 Tax=Micromonospora sp. NPDC051006 TaxID=3364283 RepID=UPI0037B912FF